MAQRTCSIDGCDKRSFSRTWCQMHYKRWWKTSTTERLPRKASPCSIDGCSDVVQARGWCHKHYARWHRHGGPLVVLESTGNTGNTTPLEMRLWPKVEKTKTCWLWTGNTYRNGYGQVYRGPGEGSALVHRVVWQMLVGPIPEGLEIDHLCRVRLCVNPAHLEPVTRAENMARTYKVGPSGLFGNHNKQKAHCPRGHPYDDENTYTPPSGGRYCRTCQANRR